MATVTRMEKRCIVETFFGLRDPPPGASQRWTVEIWWKKKEEASLLVRKALKSHRAHVSGVLQGMRDIDGWGANPQKAGLELKQATNMSSVFYNRATPK